MAKTRVRAKRTARARGKDFARRISEQHRKSFRRPTNRASDDLASTFIRETVSACGHLYRARERVVGKSATNIPDKLRILGLTFTPLCEFGHEQSFLQILKRGALAIGSKVHLGRYRDLFVYAVRDALRRDGGPPHVLCMPELSFPPVRAGSGRDRKFLERIERTIVENCPRGHDFVLIAGSHHSCRDGRRRPFNVSYLFEYDAATQKVSKKEIRKRRPAQKLGELIAIPDDIYVDVFTTRLGNILVLICIDTLDPAILWSAMHFNSERNEGNRIRLIVVPSFSKSRAIADACKRISYACNTAVCYVNFYHLHDKPTQLFISGESAEDLKVARKPVPYDPGLGPIFEMTGYGAPGVWREFVVSRELMARAYRKLDASYPEDLRDLLRLGSIHG